MNRCAGAENTYPSLGPNGRIALPANLRDTAAAYESALRDLVPKCVGPRPGPYQPHIVGRAHDVPHMLADVPRVFGPPGFGGSAVAGVDEAVGVFLVCWRVGEPLG
jgi:hypothetical protein